MMDRTLARICRVLSPLNPPHRDWSPRAIGRVLEAGRALSLDHRLPLALWPEEILDTRATLTSGWESHVLTGRRRRELVLAVWPNNNAALRRSPSLRFLLWRSAWGVRPATADESGAA